MNLIRLYIVTRVLKRAIAVQNFYTLFSLSLFTGILLPLTAGAQNSGIIASFASTLKTVDVKGDRDFRKAPIGAVVTAFGTIIDETCLTRFAGVSNRAEYVNSISLALLQSFSGAQSCSDKYGIEEVKNAISILRRSVLKCGELPPGMYARNVIAKYIKTEEQADKFVTTNFDSSWTILISSSDFKTDDERKELATSLFHEAFHSTASNNRTVAEHNENDNRDHNSCENSYYNDRVMFATALCFPTTMSITRNFWSVPGAPDGNMGPFQLFGPASCQNVCKEALTNVSEGIAESFGNAIDVETIIAKPYPPEKLDRVCKAVKDQMSLIAEASDLHEVVAPCIIGGSINPPENCR